MNLISGDHRAPWLTHLPVRWDNKPLKYVATINRMALPESTPADQLIRYIDISSVNSLGQVVNIESMAFRSAPSRARRVARHGDTIVSTVRTYLRAVASIPEDDSDLVASTGFAVVTPGPDLHAGFLSHWLRGNLFVDEVCARSVGVSYPATNASEVGCIPVPLPPLPTQKAIADFLDKKTAAIDALIEKKQTLFTLLGEKRAALINQAVTKGLDPNVPMKDSGIPPLGPVPRHWKVFRNKVLIREVTDLSTTGEEELLTVSHLTGVTPRSQKEVTMFLAATHIGYKRVQPGDLVINTMWAWMGALGTTSHQGIVSPAYGVYRFDQSRMCPEFFDLFYRTPQYVCEMTRYSRGVWSSRLRLYPESFLALRVPVPPIDEQRAIVRFIDDEVGRYPEVMGKLEAAIQRLQEYRQALITAAVTGQLDIGEAA